MSKKRPYSDFLNDMVIAARDCIAILDNISFEEFNLDQQTQVLAAHKIQVVGEAASKIPTAIRAKSTDIPWKKIVGMRNIVAHEYYRVDYEVVWQTAQKDLPTLLESIERLLAES